MRRTTYHPRATGPRQKLLDFLEPQARKPQEPPRPSTKRAAAESIKPHRAKLQDAVLAYLRGRGSEGATDEEIAVALQLRSDTARPRRTELVDLGKVRDSGRRRATSSGRAAIVWVAIPC